MDEKTKINLQQLLYKKGALITDIQILQKQLDVVDKGISEIFNQQQPPKKEAPPKDPKGKKKKKNEADK